MCLVPGLGGESKSVRTVPALLNVLSGVSCPVTPAQTHAHSLLPTSSLSSSSHTHTGWLLQELLHPHGLQPEPSPRTTHNRMDATPEHVTLLSASWPLTLPALLKAELPSLPTPSPPPKSLPACRPLTALGALLQALQLLFVTLSLLFPQY
jgi:hypothetical protein